MDSCAEIWLKKGMAHGKYLWYEDLERPLDSFLGPFFRYEGISFFQEVRY